MPTIRHVVWDWNGTLYADLEVTVDAVNAVMRRLGDVGRTYTARDYAEHYRRPVRLFYESLAGRELDDDEWRAIDGVWHRHYLEHHGRSDLTTDARAALDRVDAGGLGQSLLSMWRHDDLVPLVDEYGLTSRFALVDGLRGPGGGGKAPHLARHLEALGVRDAATVLVVGDALDDGLAAREVGANAILYDGGSHLRSQLDAFDAPVADSLLHALDLGGVPAVGGA